MRMSHARIKESDGFAPGSLADGVLAGAILIPPCHQYKEGKGSSKKDGT